MTYYYLHRPDEPAAIAYAPETVDHLIVEDGQTHPNWRPLEMTIKGGRPSDYQPNNLGLPICSKKMRKLIDENLGKSDVVEWLPVRIDGSEYFILNLPKPLDILDKEKSIMADDFVVKAVVRAEAIGDHQVFTFKGAGTTRFIVSERVKRALEAAGCKPIEFNKVALSD
jgi:hypothetical protein